MADYPLFEPAQPAGPAPAPDPEEERARRRSLALKAAFVVFAVLVVVFSWGFKVRRERLEAERAYQASLENLEKLGSERQALLDAREVQRLNREVAETRALLAAAPWTRGRKGDLASLERALASVEELVRARRYEEADRLLDEVRLAVPAGPAPSGPLNPDESSFLPVIPSTEPAPSPRPAKKKRSRRRSWVPTRSRVRLA